MEALGINWLNMAIYSAMFGIIFYFIKTKLVPKLDEALGKRQTEIDKSLILSKKAEEKQQEMQAEQATLAKKMQLEHKEKMAQIVDKANQEAKEIISQAKIKAKEIVKNGEALVAADRSALNDELEKKIATMVKKGLLWTKK